MTLTLFSVILTCTHVVVELMVPIVETGTFLMELDCYSLVLSMNVVGHRQLPSSIMEVAHLGSIAVILKLMLSMIMVWERQSMWDCMPVEVHIANGHS